MVSDEVFKCQDKLINKSVPSFEKFKPTERNFMDVLTENILKLLIKGKKLEASEIVVDYIKKDNYFFALRDDKKEELWMYKNGIYVPEGKSYIKEFCRNLLGSVYNSRFFNLVADKIVVDNYISHEEFFNSDSCEEMPVLNGILDLKTKELKPFTPKKIFFTKINAEYDPKKECKNVKKFFKDVLDPKDVPAIQELFGFCLWKDNFTETSFLFRGGGSNGKSKTFDILKTFLNPENCVSVPLSQLEDAGSFKIVELQNKLLNIAGELSKNALKETDVFKSLTGRDSITADRKFLRPVTFVNFSKMVFNCNDRPPTYDMSDGFFRRWIVFHFRNKFVSEDVYNSLKDKTGYGVKDKDIVKKIISPDELSGVLNWALEGLHRLLGNKEFSNTKSTDETRLEWLEDSNNFAVFFERNMCVSRNHLVSKEDVRGVYSGFCENNGFDPVSDKAILWYMQSKGVSSSRRTKDFGNNSDQVSCFVGCRFKQDKVDTRGWSNPLTETEISARKDVESFKNNIKEEDVL